jgi:hypothetical protein
MKGKFQMSRLSLLAQKSEFVDTVYKDNCSGKGLKIWLENLRIFCLTSYLSLNLLFSSINY